jgi:hypothetical protein
MCARNIQAGSITNYSLEDFKDYHLSNHWRPKEDFGDYINEISERVLTFGVYLLKSLVVSLLTSTLEDDRLILFHSTSTISPLDHPTGTICKPDFVACPATQEQKRIHRTDRRDCRDHLAREARGEALRHAAAGVSRVLTVFPFKDVKDS